MLAPDIDLPSRGSLRGRHGRRDPTPCTRVLLVEDDAELGAAMHAGLSEDGYVVERAGTLSEAELVLSSSTYTLVILDINLPDRSGLELLKLLRARGNDVPVLILTGNGAIEDRVNGLDAGADDYLVKPFDFDELCARLRALQRRRFDRCDGVLTHGGLCLDPAAHTVSMNGETISLPRREFAVLRLLLENRGRPLSRHYLQHNLYSWDCEVESNTIEVYVHFLRKQLGADLIRTIRGVGYVIDRK